AFTSKLFGIVPARLVVLLAVIVVLWVPFSRSAIGRAAYAVGTAENAAYMSARPVKRAKFTASALAGLLSAIGGHYLTF
ncbi:ABC transporter permease, partial [Rhizobium ruizarguesonis]